MQAIPKEKSAVSACWELAEAAHAAVLQLHQKGTRLPAATAEEPEENQLLPSGGLTMGFQFPCEAMLGEVNMVRRSMASGMIVPRRTAYY